MPPIWRFALNLLGIDKERADISGKMRKMLDAGIEIHAQVVLCPEINDGDVLKQTIEELAKLYRRFPAWQSFRWD